MTEENLVSRIRTVQMRTASGALFAIEAPVQPAELHMLRSPLVATVKRGDERTQQQVLIVATRAGERGVELFALGQQGILESISKAQYVVTSVRPMQIGDSVAAFNPYAYLSAYPEYWED